MNTPTVRTIKRYANRKMYDTTDSKYVTLEDIGNLVAAGEEILVVDNAAVVFNKEIADSVAGPERKNEDITIQTLALVIAADQVSGKPKFNVSVNDLDVLINYNKGAGAPRQARVTGEGVVTEVKPLSNGHGKTLDLGE
jgi:polyhydroxyalkanoate synthesis regulator protein